MKRGRIVGALAGLGLIAGPVLSASAQENLQGPYGTGHGDNHGTMRTTTPAGDWSAGINLAWELDVRGLGLDRPAGSPISFDAAGNLYWITSIGGGTGGLQFVASTTPSGTLRWASEAITPGVAFGNTSPVVGIEGVYALGGGNAFDWDGDGHAGQLLIAVDKGTGGTAWKLDLDGDWDNNGVAENNLTGLGTSPFTPVLKDGRLYVVLIGTSGLHLVQVNAATGLVDRYDLIDPAITWSPGRSGNMVYVDDAFGAGEDGLFFNVDEGANDFGAGTGLRDVIGIRVVPGVSGTLAWTAPGGNLARGSITYSAATGHLYAHTWNNQAVVDGSPSVAFVAYDPATGAILGSANPGFGHGFYDLGALDFDNASVIAGGFDGKLAVYVDDGAGNISTKIYLSTEEWHGEYRVFGQAAVGPGGKTLVFTGTNSRVNDFGPDFTARVVVLDASLAAFPATDDGPAYFDDISIRVGSDEASAAAAAPVFVEDFETGFATVPGPVDQSSDWDDTSGVDVVGPPLVVADPTGGAQGNVLALDPLGNQDLATQVQSALLTLPLSVPDLVNDTYVIISWKQWREDLSDNIWLWTGTQGGAFQWDSNGGIWPYGAGFTDSIPLTAGQWQDIELHYDFVFDAMTVYVDGVPNPVPPFMADVVTPISSIELTMYPTPPVASDGLVANAPIAEYDTGIAADHGFTVRGGPFLGPDGKVYYFHNGNGNLVALERVQSFVCADTNCDGVVDTADIDNFVYVVVNGVPAPGCPTSLQAADTNGDGVVDTADIDSFVAAVVAGGCVAPANP